MTSHSARSTFRKYRVTAWEKAGMTAAVLMLLIPCGYAIALALWFGSLR